ncbi:hypothetical protein AB0878_49240 [Amycolatopsis sp. NPDC047767]|uniref:hypothetical protein n=1 Tax=Amycolatopsis sp. NPDC047767 TaxID=3156765 RepID=UPI0034565ADC
MADRRTEVDGQPSSTGETLRYADMVEIGTWFDLDHRVVATWRKRYADSHPFPEPDVMTGRTPGWARSRRPEIEAWEHGRPGRGVGGGRPRKR